jgi:hypothetical protein
VALIRDLTNEQLIAEWKDWDDRIRNTKSWGAALAAANGFRKECQREINKRGLVVKNQ